MIVRRSVFSRFLRRVSQLDRWSEFRQEATPEAVDQAPGRERKDERDPRQVDRVGVFQEKLD